MLQLGLEFRFEPMLSVTVLLCWNTEPIVHIFAGLFGIMCIEKLMWWSLNGLLLLSFKVEMYEVEPIKSNLENVLYML